MPYLFRMFLYYALAVSVGALVLVYAGNVFGICRFLLLLSPGDGGLAAHILHYPLVECIQQGAFNQ